MDEKRSPDPANRTEIGADHVLILADIQVKYATMIEPRSLRESAALARAKGADAVVVTGDESGDAPSLQHLCEASGCGVPVLIGSGLNSRNAGTLLAECDGAIVGTSIMEEKSVSSDKLELLMSEARREAE